METRSLNLTTTLVMIFIAALLIGLVGGIIGAYFFARPGPEGPQGIQGTQGTQGTQGIQGFKASRVSTEPMRFCR